MKNAIDLGKVFIHVQGRDGRLIMDRWQRDYVWGIKQWRDLFETIKNVDDKTLKYIGNFIYYYPDGADSTTGDVVVVDGQQRITTITIIMAVIRDCIKEKTLENNKTCSRIDRWLTDRDENCLIAYKNSKDINRIYEEIIIKGENMILLKDKDKLFVKAYSFFKKELSNYSLNELDMMFNKICRLSVVELICESYEEAYDTFSNQSKGVMIVHNDQIKTTLMDIIAKSDADKDSKDNLSDTIQDIFITIDDSFFSRYNYYYNGIWAKRNKILAPIKDSISNIEDVYKIIDFYNKEARYKSDDKHLSQIKFYFAHPALLILYEDLIKYNVDLTTRNIIYKVFRNALIRSIIFGKNKIHEEIFVGVVEKIIKANISDYDIENYIKETLIKGKKLFKNDEIIVVSDDDLKESLQSYNLYKAKHNLASLILWDINRYFEQKKGIKEIGFIENPTIDHISPQINKSNIMHTIGNLTILSKGDNSSKGKLKIKNSFEKIKGSCLKINENLCEFINNKDEWTDNDIRCRTNYLSNIILELY